MSRHRGKKLSCIAFDLGASGGKAMRGAFDGSHISLEQVYRFPNCPIRLQNHIYWDALGLLDEVKKGLAVALRGPESRPASVGLDTWGNDFCFLDKNGNLVENPHSYRDPRTDGVMEKAFKVMPRRDIYMQTGVQFMQHNTLFQVYSLVLERSPLLKASATYLMIPDLFNYWLTGEKYCEFTDATSTEFYDPYKDDWHWQILNAFEIPRKLMPPVVKPGARLGKLDRWLCQDLDIPAVPVIAVGAHDTASAASVVPAKEGGYAFLSSGTWSLFGAETTKVTINEAGLKYNFTCYGGVCNTYLIWKNIQALWLLQECQRVWNEQGNKYTNEDLIAMAVQAKPFGPVIDTDNRLFLTPGDFPARIVEFCRATGQKLPEDHGEVVRCILESLALKYRYTLERLEKVMSTRLDRIYVVGGGSRNELLNQLAADATGVPVITGHPEATALGNIMMQLISLGEVRSLQESREIIRHSFRSRTYKPKTSDRWDAAYDRFMEAVRLGSSRKHRYANMDR